MTGHGLLECRSSPADALDADAALGGLLIDLGNPRCPVMNGAPDGRTFSRWRGLRIGHCCGTCVSRFAADPEWYLEATGIEWRGAAGMVRSAAEARGAERADAFARLRSRWTVVREPDAD